jgi:hypothetical protein
MANALAWGFAGIQDVFARRLAEVNADVVNTAISQSLAFHNRVLNELLSMAVGRTLLTSERFLLPGAGTLQPLDEWGNPLPVRIGGYADIAFPIVHAGTAWGTNRVSRELMTVAEANEYQVMVQQQDTDWLTRHILAAMLDDTSYTFADPQTGDVTVYPLANGDTQTYMGGGGTMATDDHYLAQAAAIADAANPYPTIYTELTEHPGNLPPVVAYIPSALRATTEALATFVPVADTDITPGSGSDRLGAVPASIRAFGDEVLGKVDGVWIVLWAALPAEHIVAFAIGAGSPALAMREYPSPALQGLFEEDHSPDGNRFERRFIRMAGFGARNRTAALVYQVGNATYEIPTGYNTPLPV